MIPVPMCVVGPGGDIVAANELVEQVFKYNDIVGSNFFALTGVKRENLLAADGEEGQSAEKVIFRCEKYFSLKARGEADSDGDIQVFFIDVTERENLKSDYKAEKLCITYISIDNYDDFESSLGSDKTLEVVAAIDKTIRAWAEKQNASINRIKDDMYIMFVYKKEADRIIEDKFSILDEVRNLDVTSEFPLSLSIGMGLGISALDDAEELAQAAHDLAMGRGGDQAVVKNRDRTHYYGGTLQVKEKNRKGKSRVIAHALRQLVRDSSRVLIMGHRQPDMDCFGSAIGAHRLATLNGKEAHIVIDGDTDGITAIYKQMKATDSDAIINNRKALEICDRDTLLIIVDTNRPILVECPELLGMVDHIAVVDHHRMTDDAVDNATIAYVESYASSASELMTEILQYSSSKRVLTKFEAEALLAGITVDTNSFSIKTGVRTFEAAAWLRRIGADTTEVKRFFQMDASFFQSKAEAIVNAEYLEEGIAISIRNEEGPNEQIINAQVADELLMIRGVKASFVVGRNMRGNTIVSARSLGELNVQYILEKFGGGGHLTSAGAQVDMTQEEFVEKLKGVLSEMTKDEPNKDNQ